MRNRQIQILVPRIVDTNNRNAQNLNAKALLSRFQSAEVVWHTFYYDEPDTEVARRTNVRCHQLRRGRCWTWDALRRYQGDFDGIFYPGNEWYDALALVLRRLTRRRVPVIGTLEGIPGNQHRETELSSVLGRPIRCFRPRSGPSFTWTHDLVRNHSDVTIAISPFLRQVGEVLYSSRFLNLSLGIDELVFNTNNRTGYPGKPIAIGAGTLYDAKRPGLFLRLGKSFPHVTFVWYGDGPLRQQLLAQTEGANLANVHFPGGLCPSELSRRFQQGSFFVLPSLSEGVPKVALEAAACGMAAIVFGYYDTPTVLQDSSGFVVFTDDELVQRVSELAASPATCEQMGQTAAQLSHEFHWTFIARRWEQVVVSQILAAGSAAS